ncbi:MAG TPA: hypothetical protein VKB09_12085 [Thermomicrobiales bacterium]|nr:hypothetical protein [Thermomicrobiales bacterium]
MAIAMFMHWDGVTADQFDQVRKVVNWEGDPAAGGKLHIAAVDERGLHVTDLWDSAEAFQTFVATRLMPGVKQVGIPSEPKVDIVPVHALFTPAYKPA